MPNLSIGRENFQTPLATSLHQRGAQLYPLIPTRPPTSGGDKKETGLRVSPVCRLYWRAVWKYLLLPFPSESERTNGEEDDTGQHQTDDQRARQSGRHRRLGGFGLIARWGRYRDIR